LSYNYDLNTHNKTDPSIIVPLLIDLFSPTSVIDIGCGLGNFLFEFKKNSICDVLGVDGDMFSDIKRAEFLAPNEFLRGDLTKSLNINRKFELALCLEVAEHLPLSAADQLVKELISISDIVVFSAAVPLQGGQFHVNEQWQSYWAEKFEKYNYCPVDCIRPVIWNNMKVSYWYKQNLVVYISKNSKKYNERVNLSMSYFNIVHPENYFGQVDYLHKLLSGKSDLKFYLYLLFKYFKNFVSLKSYHKDV